MHRARQLQLQVGLGLAGLTGAGLGPIKKEIRPRRLRDKRRPEIRVVSEMLDGRVLSLQKTIRVCG